MEPLLVNKNGDKVFITGDGFIDTPFTNCKFGNVMATYIKFYNRTTIECGTPLVTDSSLDWTVYITLNGFEFKDFVNIHTAIH